MDCVSNTTIYYDNDYRGETPPAKWSERDLNPEPGDLIVSFAAVIWVVTHRSSPLTAAHSSSAFLSSN